MRVRVENNNFAYILLRFDNRRTIKTRNVFVTRIKRRRSRKRRIIFPGLFLLRFSVFNLRPYFRDNKYTSKIGAIVFFYRQFPTNSISSRFVLEIIQDVAILAYSGCIWKIFSVAGEADTLSKKAVKLFLTKNQTLEIDKPFSTRIH